MLEILKEIFTSPAGSFGSMFALFLLVFFLVYKAGKIVEKYRLLEKLAQSIDVIKDDISEIKASIKMFRQDSSGFARSQSPIALTEKGNNVAADLHIERAISKKWDKLNKKIKEKLKEEDNPYDIQGICFEFGESYSKLISENDYDFIKKYAFNKGHNLSDFDIIFGIYIRDKYFSENNIDVSDVDNHDPEKQQQ